MGILVRTNHVLARFNTQTKISLATLWTVFNKSCSFAHFTHALFLPADRMRFAVEMVRDASGNIRRVTDGRIVLMEMMNLNSLLLSVNYSLVNIYTSSKSDFSHHLF